MKEELFIDTWGWLVIHNKREPQHTDVNKFYRRFRAHGGAIYTTDYVLDETLTLLFRRLSFSVAGEAMSILDNAIKQGYLKLEWVSPQRFEKAKELRLRFQDKPEISFTDLTSMVVMKELDLISILTDDDHFIHVGMGFSKAP
ncbi:MAG: PIN domain-containing protein [Nitrospirota bacterium]